MGKGTDLARLDAPEHAQLIDDFKDQLLIALVKRLGREVSIPAAEVDATGRYVLLLSVDGGNFHFELQEKQ